MNINFRRHYLARYSDNFWGFSQTELAELNSLTHQLHKVISQINGVAPLTTFFEFVDEQQSVCEGETEILMLEVDGSIKGFLLLINEKHPVVSALVVDHQYRRHGLGSVLFKYALNEYPDKTFKLFCLKRSEAAFEFYTTHGGIIDHDYRSKFSHLFIFPSVHSLRYNYALSFEHDKFRKNKGVG